MLELNAREMLIARMQVWVYENVTQGCYRKAEQLAGELLAQFDDMVENKPLDSAGYWGGFYFERFKQGL
jgi:hypothetical protein